MRKTRDTLQESRKSLGISYHTYHLFELNEKNIKKVISKNENYQLSKKELLELNEKAVYQYEEEFDEIQIENNEVIIDGYVIGKVKSKAAKQMIDHEYECFIYGGNIKRLIYQNDEPVDVKTTLSNIFYGHIDIRDL